VRDLQNPRFANDTIDVPTAEREERRSSLEESDGLRDQVALHDAAVTVDGDDVVREMVLRCLQTLDDRLDGEDHQSDGVVVSAVWQVRGGTVSEAVRERRPVSPVHRVRNPELEVYGLRPVLGRGYHFTGMSTRPYTALCSLKRRCDIGTVSSSVGNRERIVVNAAVISSRANDAPRHW